MGFRPCYISNKVFAEPFEVLDNSFFKREVVRMKKHSLIATMIAIMACSVIAEDEVLTISTGNTVGMYYATSSAVGKIVLCVLYFLQA